MPLILDYATPQPRHWDVGRKLAATLPLSLGLVAYALLCIPAARQRGYPPIDHLWTGVTYLWPFPVPLFMFCWPKGRFSKTVLLLYAIVSGYIDACTIVMMVPNRFSFIWALVNSVYVIPVHLVGVGIVAWVSRSLISRLGSFQENTSKYCQRVFRVAGFTVIVLLAFLFPFIYRHVATLLQENGGRNGADADWANHKAVILNSDGWDSEHSYGNATIVSYIDLDSGLRYRSDHHMGYEQAYKDRIQELIRIHGVPPWSLKNRLVSDADLVAMLTAQTMQPVSTFPYNAAPGITLMRNGTVSGSGGSTNFATSDLTIDAQFSGMNCMCQSGDPAYVGRLKKYPGIVFVRCGQKWVAACTDDGWILGYAALNWR